MSKIRQVRQDHRSPRTYFTELLVTKRRRIVWWTDDLASSVGGGQGEVYRARVAFIRLIRIAVSAAAATVVARRGKTLYFRYRALPHLLPPLIRSACFCELCSYAFQFRWHISMNTFAWRRGENVHDDDGYDDNDGADCDGDKLYRKSRYPYIYILYICIRYNGVANTSPYSVHKRRRWRDGFNRGYVYARYTLHGHAILVSFFLHNMCRLIDNYRYTNQEIFMKKLSTRTKLYRL